MEKFKNILCGNNIASLTDIDTSAVKMIAATSAFNRQC